MGVDDDRSKLLLEIILFHLDLFLLNKAMLDVVRLSGIFDKETSNAAGTCLDNDFTQNQNIGDSSCFVDKSYKGYFQAKKRLINLNKEIADLETGNDKHKEERLKNRKLLRSSTKSVLEDLYNKMNQRISEKFSESGMLEKAEDIKKLDLKDC